MQWLRGFILLWLVASAASAQFAFGPKYHTKARLVLSHEMVKPGETVLAGIELKMDRGWHTYWRNPGNEFGLPTEVLWNASAAVVPGEIQWPVPTRYVDRSASDAINYVYDDRVVLIVPLKISANAALGEEPLLALVKWLECQTSCIPGSNLVRATLTIGNESKPTADASFFTEAQKHLPSTKLPGTTAGKWDQPGDVTNRAFVIEWNTSATDPDFFPYTNALANISSKTTLLVTNGSNVILRKFATRTGDAWPKEIAGLLARKEGDSLVGYEVALSLPDTAFAGEKKSLWVWLLNAFVGGLILNIMPCVLPVIALKILGFVNQSQEHPRRVRALGLLYTLGVVASFLVCSGIVIGLKAAGQKVGWGFQFGNPQFIVVLTVAVTLVALNLFGIFEVTLSGGAMGAASGAASKHGSAGAFMNGVLATVLATPCVAPFLGAAVGFALAQPAHIVVLFFVTIALGLALPYLLLSWNPAWLKFLPKPGAWMERFKVAMGFPMAATAVWLMSLTVPHYGDRFWWLGMFLVIVSLAAWIYGQFFQRGSKRRGLALAFVMVLLAGGYVFAVEKQLRWREPIAETAGGAETFQDEPGGIVWRRWNAENVAKFRAEGRPILVDFTARWCVTCNTIVKPALESQAVRNKLKEINGVALLADRSEERR